MKSDVVEDWLWADGHLSTVQAILRANAMHLLSIEVAPPEQDLQEATDLIVRVTGGEVAVRIRRPDCLYRDLTIRTSRPSGAKTELEKIRAGFGRWYLYAWADASGRLPEWILVDLDILRPSGLLDDLRKERKNRDGTRFLPIGIPQLRQHGCLVACQLRPQHALPKHQPPAITGRRAKLW